MTNDHEAAKSEDASPACPAGLTPNREGNARLVTACLRFTCAVAVLSVGALTLTSYGGAWHEYADRFAHFRVFYLIASVVLAVALGGLRSWRWMAAAVVCCLVNGMGIVPWFIPPGSQGDVAETADLSIVQSNVAARNRHPEQVVRFAGEMQPDIFVAFEMSPRVVEALEPLRSQFDYMHRDVGRPWTYGLGVYSRFPLTPIPIAEESPLVGRAIAARVALDGGTLTLIAAHPMGLHSLYPERYKPQMAALAELVRSVEGPCIVVGDLNTTMWSSDYRKLIAATKLENARRGFGVLPTWPLQYAPIMIPIDHCLYSPGITATACATGADVGSDHLPLCVELSIPW